jgi:signal transduction histidine kinase
MNDYLKYIFLTVLSLFFRLSLQAQEIRSFNEDSLKAILEITGRDSTRVRILLQLSESFFFKNPDTSFFYGDQAMELSREVNFRSGLLEGLVASGEGKRQLGNYVDAMKRNWELLELSGRLKDKRYQAIATGLIGLNYRGLHDYDRAIKFLRRSLEMLATRDPEYREVVFSVFLANTYLLKNMTDSAFYFLRASEHRYRAREIQLKVFRLACFGIAFSQVEDYDSMNYYYRRALSAALPDREAFPNISSGLASNLSDLLISQNQLDSAFWLGRLAFNVADKANLDARVYEASEVLSRLHRIKGNLDSALYYQDIFIARKDSIFGEKNIRELQLLLLDEQKRAHEIQQAEEQFQNNVIIVGLVTITTIILVASILLFRSNRVKQKTNLTLQQTLKELKATQSQLIQSEKMASLGELTAGIAHEIQNPLNFVNNFSEVNTELISEMKKEMAEGNGEGAVELANTIEENEQKINYHGKRADGIVKSMLLHSRSSSGQKELTMYVLLITDTRQRTGHSVLV